MVIDKYNAFYLNRFKLHSISSHLILFAQFAHATRLFIVAYSGSLVANVKDLSHHKLAFLDIVFSRSGTPSIGFNVRAKKKFNWLPEYYDSIFSMF